MLALPTLLVAVLALARSLPVLAYVPASASPNQFVDGNATLRASWTNTDLGSSGLFGGTLGELSAGDGSGIVASNTTPSYALVTYFDENTALFMNRSLVPFFALINCDANETFATTVGINATAGNATVAATNGTVAQNTTSLDAFTLAAALDAQAVILYSLNQESCVLSAAYLSGNTSKPLPIYTSPSKAFTDIIAAQLANLNASHTTFNTTILNAVLTAANLTSISASTIQAAAFNFLLGNITYYNSSLATNESTSPTVATIGHAPSSTATVGPTASASSGAGSGFGGVQGVWSSVKGTALALGLVAGATTLWL